MTNAILLACFLALLAILFLTLRSRSHPGEARQIRERVDSIQRLLDSSLSRISRLEEKAGPVTPEKDEREDADRPMNTESVRTALRYNGFSPEISGTDLDDWQTVRFKVEDTFFRIDTSRLPFLTLELGFRMDKDEDLDLMYRAARDVTAGIVIGKVNVFQGEDESAVVFQAEFIADRYPYFRDNFKEYLNIVIETHKRFFETYNNLKEEKQKEMERIGQVMTQPRPGPDSKKVLS